MSDTYDGSYVYDKVKYEFPLPSFTMNEILDYVEEYCFIDKARYGNPLAEGWTQWNGDIWAGYGKKPNNNLMGWYISFNANKINANMRVGHTNKKLIWNNYANPPYIGYYDGLNYYTRQMDMIRKNSNMKKIRHDLKAFNIKIDSDDFILMEDDELNEKYFNTPHRVVTIWASMDFVTSMAHFRIDENLIIWKKLDFINWPLEKPQGLI